MARKLVNDWGQSATLVVKGYGRKAAGWEFKSSLSGCFVRTIRYYGCKGQGEFVNTQMKEKKEKKNQASTCNL
jgi:hypothetical protein